MSLITLDSVSYTYPDAKFPAIRDVSLSVEKGDYIALIGNNGSGKSTLVRLFNGLRKPGSGSVRVKGMDPASRGAMFAVRSAVALVFQSPVDQIVSSCVEEDAAFGPANLGLPRAEIERRVDAALASVGMTEVRKRSTRSLSGGQQQKLAIAGALAMEPECIVFDEATSMLDPGTKADVIGMMDRLARSGMAIVHVTHDMDDAARAGRIVALDSGRLVFDGSPEDFFLGAPGGQGTYATSRAFALGFGPPKAVEAASVLGVEAALSDRAESLAAKIASLARSGGTDAEQRSPARDAVFPAAVGHVFGSMEFAFQNASFSYLRGTAGEVRALSNVTLEVPKGSLVAFVGRTGSGKSTALQLMNSLLQPGAGSVVSLGRDTKSASLDARALRMSAPLSIQRPESALFELYAADDVAFGPRNEGLSGSALVDRVRSWMDAVGVPYGQFRDRMTRSLSGGEKRKLALAGVFALESEAVLLDEPTAALDPESQKSVFELVRLFSEQGRTVVFATHSMEEAVRADLVAVFAGGKLAAFAPPAKIFYELYDPSWGLALPYAARLAERLRELGVDVPGSPLSLGELKAALGAELGAASGGRP